MIVVMQDLAVYCGNNRKRQASAGAKRDLGNRCRYFCLTHTGSGHSHGSQMHIGSNQSCLLNLGHLLVRLIIALVNHRPDKGNRGPCWLLFEPYSQKLIESYLMLGTIGRQKMDGSAL